MSKTSILIAEKSCLIRKGLRSLLQKIHNVELLPTIVSEEDVCDFVNQNQPDILIVNPDMLQHNCIDLKKKLSLPAKMSLVLISDQKKIQDKHKADGYIHYMDGQNSILELIQKLINDKNQNSTEGKSNETLSAREKNILKHIALGLTNKEIADQLFISIHTVVTHRKNITQKLGIKSVSGLTVYAILNNLISMDEVK